jgi:hypothetical protein
MAADRSRLIMSSVRESLRDPCWPRARQRADHALVADRSPVGAPQCAGEAATPRRQRSTADTVKAACCAALTLLVSWSDADGQTGSTLSYTDMTLELCRQYAAAVSGMPANLAFDQCMTERHCRVSAGSTLYQCETPGPMSWHGGGY